MNFNLKALEIHEEELKIKNYHNANWENGKFTNNPESLFYKMKQFLKIHPEAPNHILFDVFIEGERNWKTTQKIRDYKSKILKKMRINGELATNKDINEYDAHEQKLKQFKSENPTLFK